MESFALDSPISGCLIPYGFSNQIMSAITDFIVEYGHGIRRLNFRFTSQRGYPCQNRAGLAKKPDIYRAT